MCKYVYTYIYILYYCFNASMSCQCQYTVYILCVCRLFIPIQNSLLRFLKTISSGMAATWICPPLEKENKMRFKKKHINFEGFQLFVFGSVNDITSKTDSIPQKPFCHLFTWCHVTLLNSPMDMTSANFGKPRGTYGQYSLAMLPRDIWLSSKFYRQTSCKLIH